MLSTNIEFRVCFFSKGAIIPSDGYNHVIAGRRRFKCLFTSNVPKKSGNLVDHYHTPTLCGSPTIRPHISLKKLFLLRVGAALFFLFFYRSGHNRSNLPGHCLPQLFKGVFVHSLSQPDQLVPKFSGDAAVLRLPTCNFENSSDKAGVEQFVDRCSDHRLHINE